MSLKTLRDTPPWDWPADATETVLRALRDPGADVSERAMAVELAGDPALADEQLVQALLAVVRSADEPEALRCRAAIAFGPTLEECDLSGFDDPDEVPIGERLFHEVHDALRALYTDAAVPKDLRRRALEAAVRAPQDWHTGAVRAAYASEDANWKLTGVFCMRYLRGFDAEILASLDSADADVRFEAVTAAGEWGLDGAWRTVSELAKSSATDKALRLAAIEAIAQIRPKEAEPLLEELAETGDEDVVDAAEEALALSGLISGDDASDFDDADPDGDDAEDGAEDGDEGGAEDGDEDAEDGDEPSRKD